MVVETEAASGAHNNQPTNGSDMTAEMALFAVAAVVSAAAVAAEVATAAMSATVAMQTVAAATAVHEIYIKRGGNG